jgi:hypothetical protein
MRNCAYGPGRRRCWLRDSNFKELCRHCEERSDEAIHSFFARRDGLLRFARNDGVQTCFRALAARCARAVQKSSARSRAQGTPGACCTRGLACNMCREHAHEHTGTVGAFRRPCAMVLRLMPRSPRRRIRLVTVIGGLKVLPRPVGLAKTSADLTPATGARTTRFCRTLQRRFVSRACCPLTDLKPALRTQPRPTLPRPPHLIPTFVTTADAPRAE